MDADPVIATPPIAWSVGARAFGNQARSGDLHVVAACTGGVLIAAIDGLGHGPEAADAAKAAETVLRGHADEPLAALVQRCHADLRGTRGVVLSLASFDAQADRMTWLGVGNVDGVLIRADAAAMPPRHGIPLRGGVVGYQIPSLRVQVLSVAPGDTLIFATDGIRGEFASEPAVGRRPDQIAGDIITGYAKSTDDALVLVARYVGRAS